MIRVNKKGIELQFFWVFVMIAGALILIFFFSLSQRYKAFSEEKLSFEISNTLDTIITEISQSPDVIKEIPIPKQGVGFFCQAECDCKIKIGKSSYSLGFDKLIFSHGLLEHKNIILWSKPFKMPFRITNFLYATNKMVLYVFIKDESVSSEIFDELRKSVEDKIENIFVSDPTSVKESGYSSYKFIFIGQEPGNIDSSFEKKIDVKAIYFEDPLRMDSIQFYIKKEDVSVFEKDESTPERIHLPSQNIPMILAGIFSDDYKMFSCNAKEAFRKMSFVTEVYIQRIRNLMDLFKGTLGKCVMLNSAMPDLDVLKTSSNNLFKEFDNPSNSISYLNEIMQVLNPVGLPRKNQVFIQEGCPAVY